MSRNKHSHPGGTAAVLGVQLARFSSMQGVSLLLTNLLHYSSIVVVAWFLGPDSLGAYALLFFMTGLVTQLIHLASKPGTIRRTFGVADDDDGDVEEDETEEEEGVSERPPYTLGVGIVWCTLLAAAVVALVFALRDQIAQFLLGDSSQADAVVLATLTGAVWAIFKLAEIVLWFERRPTAYVLIDASRPTFNLIAIVAILAAGAGVEGAIAGMAIGTTAATVLCLVFLRPSYELGFSLGELGAILRRGANRVPIASSMWVIQNADMFILSRFVSHGDLGLYNLASRTGFMVSFLPQGFRMALRPMRKTAVYKAYREEYGQSVAQGQLLAYFCLLSLTAVLAMVLGGELLIHVAPSSFESAAPLIPLTAGAMTMPALYRTISGMSVYPRKRLTFIASTIFAALAYVGFMLFLVPEIGIYGAPVSLLIGFSIPATYMFLRSQLGPDPIDFPYLAILQAFLVAGAIAVGFHLVHPSDTWLQLATIVVLMGVWFASLFLLRIIPEYHWRPIKHIARSFFRGSALEFDPAAGLAELRPEERQALHRAVIHRLPTDALAAARDGAGAPEDGSEDTEGARLVRFLRRAGRQGGVPIQKRTDNDAGISLFLFSNEPVSVRQAKMRSLLSAGADSHDLRTLEDIVESLAKAPPHAWGDDVLDSGGSRRRVRPRLRRA